MKSLIAFYEKQGNEFVPVVTFHTVTPVKEISEKEIGMFRKEAEEMGFEIAHHEVREGTVEAREELQTKRIPA